MRRHADVVFRPARVAVYVDGCFWHRCPDHFMWPKANAEWWRQKIERNQARDADTDAQLTAAGWVPFHVWEHEDLEAAADRLLSLVQERLPITQSGREEGPRWPR